MDLLPSDVGERPVRSFVAVELSGVARAAVAEYLAALAAAPAAAWTAPENLHVTLKFLGDVAPVRLEALARRLEAVATAAAPFTMLVRGVGAFPSLRAPHVIWVGASTPALAALACAVEGACAAEGFPPDSRPFHAHVTLGRVRGRPGPRRPPRAADPSAALAALAADGARDFGVAPVDTLVLFQSRLGPGGARHTPLVRLPLGGGASAPPSDAGADS